MRDHIVFHISTTSNFCRHCGRHEPIKMPAPVTTLMNAMDQFRLAHEACERPEVLHVPPLPDRELPVPATALEPWPGLADWLRDGETGMSSLSMAATLTGLPLTDETYWAPADAGDFGRCLGLLEAVPSLRARLPLAGPWMGAEWKPILRHWPELEQLAVAGMDHEVTALLRRLRA